LLAAISFLTMWETEIAAESGVLGNKRANSSPPYRAAKSVILPKKSGLQK
jgi:hypothetical protein